MNKNETVISMNALRTIRLTRESEKHYFDRLDVMDKLDLLEEMIRFQEERNQAKGLTVRLMIKGQALFKHLERNAETEQLKILSRSYQKHLAYELRAFSLGHSTGNEADSNVESQAETV